MQHAMLINLTPKVDAIQSNQAIQVMGKRLLITNHMAVGTCDTRRVQS